MNIPDAYARISDDLTLHYQQTGHGPIHLIFVPGWTMTTKSFEQQLTYFADSEEYTALTYDPRAQGLSSVTTDGHHYEQHGKDLRALIEHLGIEQFVLIGWSSGGGDVLEYLRLYGPDGLRAFVLLEAWPKSRAYDYETEWVPFGTKDLGDQDDFLKGFVLDVVTNREKATREAAEWICSEKAPPELLDMVIAMSRCTPDSIAALLNATAYFLDNTADLERIDGDVPLLYYTREEQSALAQKWAAEHTPSATVISHGGHMMFWEEAELFNENFHKFLQSSGL